MKSVRFLRRLTSAKNAAPIAVVSGLPRSGTSLMMQMLAAGGISPLTDGVRQADESNPRGYYEFERVKRLDKGDTAWIADAPGKVVKIVSPLIVHLPAQYAYQIVFMQRDLDEVYRSQAVMLEKTGKATDHVTREQLVEMYRQHLQSISEWMRQQPNIDVCYVNYHDLMVKPAPAAAAIAQFIHHPLNVQKMLNVIDPELYRSRTNPRHVVE